MRNLRALFLQNWRLAILVVGFALLIRGIASWSQPAAEVFAGAVLAALALVPSFVRRARAREF